MSLGNMVAIIAIVTALASAIVFIINAIIAKTKHETGQDDKIKGLIEHREQCIMDREKKCTVMEERIARLETNDRDRELKMEALLNAHETTQSLIIQLQSHQQETFVNLIDTIKDLSKK